MKNKKIIAAAVTIPLVCATTLGQSTFAANPYGIQYSGGTPLDSSNVQINPNLIDELTTIMSGSGAETSFSSSSEWKDGYLKSGENCISVKYAEVSANDAITASDNLGLKFSKNQYSVDINFKNISLEGITDNSEKVLMSIIPGQPTIWGAWVTYADATCTEYIPGEIALSAANNERIFIEMNIKLYREGQDSVFTADDLYFGITDIDASQSFKILNSGNGFSPSNMFAKNATDLQPTDPSITLRNMYVANGNYIYAQYNPETGESFATPSNSNIYTKLTKTTQQNGLDVVFGFSGGAASGIEYYAKQYSVAYRQGSNGKIDGVTEEDIISGSYPSGSEVIPNEGFKLSHWVADVDVTLKDGTVIKTGEPILNETIRNIVVNQDIVFTAVYSEAESETNIVVPNTGTPAGGVNAILVPASIISTLAGALFIRFLPRLTRKKIDFDK